MAGMAVTPRTAQKNRGLQEAEKAGYAATEAVAAGSQSRQAAVILVTVFWKWQQGRLLALLLCLRSQLVVNILHLCNHCIMYILSKISTVASG